MAEASGLIRRFYEEVVRDGNLDLIDELTTEDFTDHEEGFPGQPAGREGVKFFVNTMREAFSDIRAETLEPVLADGNLEAVRAVFTGTHDGELLGVAPTGKTVKIETIDIIRVQDGKVAEHWGLTDNLSLMQQLGALPE
jgi:predicted ester cyclase